MGNRNNYCLNSNLHCCNSFGFCTNIDFDLSQKSDYISCSSDSDCIPERCGCLNEKGVKKFRFLTTLCGVSLHCKLPTSCTCESNQCQSHYDYGTGPEIQGEGVILVTDKTEYNKGEEVKVTVKNNLDNKIEFYTIDNEFFNGTVWELIDWDIDCPCLAKCKKAPIILNPKEETEFIWDQTGDDCQQVSEGKYRFRADWRDLTKEDYEIPAAVSNEFIIR